VDGEFRFRAVILETFAAYLADKRRSHLDRHHLRYLEDLRSRFTRWALVKARGTRKTVRIAHDEGWKLPADEGSRAAA
jgi:hypothetical protein